MPWIFEKIIYNLTESGYTLYGVKRTLYLGTLKTLYKPKL